MAGGARRRLRDEALNRELLLNPSVATTIMRGERRGPAEQPFIISYWCGPPVAEITLERRNEIAECGFNVRNARKRCR